MHKQCCVCKLPAAPHGVVDITHGYHRECFITFYKEDSTLMEMVPELDEEATWVEDEPTLLKVAPIR